MNNDTLTLVTGGTGTLGKLVVPRLQEAGARVRVLSRSAHDSNGFEYVRGDLDSGDGVEAAVAGADVVVHLAGSAKGDGDKARTLVGAAAAAGVRHVVYISVVGADRVPVVGRTDRAMFGYYAAKHEAEQVVADSGIPYTTLRATQFHDLILTVVRGLAKLPVAPVLSGFRFQPVDTAEVADRLVDLTLAAPGGLVPEMGGPRVYELRELLRSYLDACGKHRLTLPVHPPGKAARAMRDGANLTPDHAVGRRTWEEFLAVRV